MASKFETFIWTLNAVDFLIAAFLYIEIHGTAFQEVTVISGPGYLFAFAFFLIAASMFLFYSDEYFLHSKILATGGMILLAISLVRAVEELVTVAYNNSLANTAIPPFYVPPKATANGEVSLASRVGAVFITLSSVMAYPAIVYEDYERAKLTTYMLAHVSLPSIVILSGAILGHPKRLMQHSRNFVLLRKFVILLPLFSLVLIDVMLMAKSIYLKERVFTLELFYSTAPPIMGTLMDAAKRGVITEEMRIVAEREGVSPEFVRDMIARGRIIIPHNVVRRDRDDIRIEGIGEGLRTKVNANIGTSTLVIDPEMELEKLRVAIKYGADSVMDLSTGGDLDEIRRMLIKEATVMFGTVPIYQAFIDVAKREGAGIYMTEDDVLKTIEKHLKDGVDFMTLHAGVTLDIAKKLQEAGGRGITGVPSRGGSILIAWMLYHNEENPLWKNRDYILEMMREYDAAVSLGDALRPAGIADAHDRAQLSELINNARLVERCRKAGVQVMVEGPGHVPMHQVEADVRIEKAITKGAPYYVLGPIVTDIFPGYDHITSAIGAAIAAAAGADMICYVTPAEHLSLPNVEQVKEGVIAARIAAHAGDIVKLGERAAKIDYEMDKARAALDRNKMREIAPDKELFDRIRGQFVTPPEGMCTMCGELCVYLLLDKFFKKEKKRFL